MNPRADAAAVDIVVSCADLGATLAFYTEQLGFRLDAIFPADDPSVATLSGYGLRLRLEREGAVPSLASDDGRWVQGRAGMRYRDLVPDREGGGVIASHIQIPEAGPVPDYVHFHRVRFQMIYGFKGWVRVVYEDQGPPFVLRVGDCVLQPPEIRHRVLEASSGAEVIEIGSPAQHETVVDHELQLPTATARRDRVFGGQRFVRHEAASAEWRPWRVAGFEARDTGIGAATGGLAEVHVLRRVGPQPTQPTQPTQLPQTSRRDGEILLQLVLDGGATLRREGRGDEVLTEGDSCVTAADVEHSWTDASSGLEMLVVALR